MKATKNYYIGDIYDKIKDKVSILESLDMTTARILRYILEEIDYSVPSKLFKEWADGDTVIPLTWNGINYHWGKKEAK